MITVYESRETNFKHNGLGVLRPSSCLIYEELNGEYSLTLKHPIDNYEKWKLLEQDRIIKANGQLFRIYKLTHSVMDNEVEVFAMHIFYDLSKNFIKDINIVDKTGKQALNHILDNTLYESDFTCDSDITKINSARLVRKNVTSALIGDDENSFLNYWGGELKRDNFNFQINTVIGKNKGMKISYGKNLTGLTATFDMSNIVTRIVPVAFDGITLPEVYVDSDYVNNYAQPIVREVEFSDVKFASSPNNTSEEGFATKEEVYAELRRLSKLMFTNDKIDVPEINFNVDFVELSKTEQYKKYSNLETVELGDVVNIHHKVLGINIDARVISYEFNCLTNRYDSIELGSFQTNIFTGINELIKREDINMQTITDLVNVSYENAVNEATLLITNGLGGYVVKTRDELLIMDSDDINTAKNVWRWNINGLGFSSTGYNGTYGLAMTHDGQIVANRITAGELNGEIIRANSISTNHLKVEAARKIESSQSEEEVRTLIEATLGSFEVTITDKYEAKIDDELNSFSNNYYTKVETESKIQQNASSITSTVNANYTTLNNKFNNYPTTTQMNSAIQQKADSITSTVNANYTTLNNKFNNYPTTAQMNSAIEQKADSITSTVNVNYTTLNDKFNNYSTTAQMNSAIEQKANEINLGVNQTINSIQTGGKNLIKNGNFEDGLNHWVFERFSGSDSASVAVWTGNQNDYRDEWCMDGKKQCVLYVHSIDDSNRRGEWTVRQSFKTVVGQEYTISYMIAGHGSNKTVAVMENINWDHLGTKYYGDLRGGKNANDWVYDSITFTATTSESMIWFIMSEVIYGADGHMWFTDVCCVEGNKAQRFIPSLEEYSTTTQMNSAIQLKVDSITSTVNANYTTLNNKFNDYPTTTQMNSAIEQTKDSIKSEVSKIEKSMAIDNLLANGNFTNGLNNWTYNGYGYDIVYSLSTNTYWTMAGKTALLLQCSNHPQGVDSGFTQVVNVKRNTDYTFTGYIASHRAEGLAIIKDAADNWLTFDKTNPDGEEYTGTYDITKWKRIRFVINSGERDELILHLAMGTSREDGHVWFHDFMVTEGDIDLCWKPSERETRTQINQLSDRITSTVSSVETVDGKVNQAQSQIDQQAQQILSTVSYIDDVNGKVNQAQSQINQLSDSITSEVVKIEKSMAIDNLLANGNFTNGLNNWTYISNGSDVGYTLSSNTDWTMVGKTALLLTQSYHQQGVDSGFTQTVSVKRNTNYTFTGYVASHRAEGLAIIKDAAGNWLTFDKTDPYYDEYTGTDDISKWKRIRLVYYSGERDQLQLHLAMGKSNDDGHVWFHDFMVTEGETDLCWKPSERETRTQINQLSDRITSTVSSVETVNGKVDQAQSQINQLSDRITSTVSSIQTVDGKVNQAQSQIDQQANQIASKVNSGDLSSLIQQNSSSIYTAISNGRGVNGVGIDSSGLYLHNNDLVTARLTEGKFHAYNSWNGNHMGYFGTNGDDLRACLYDTNTFSVYSNDTALLFKARYERDASYGNATLDMCGGINFIHKPGQNVGINQIVLGNDDRADIYGYHNLSIRAHNSLGFMDNNGLTNMFFATRTGSIVMKGTVYQNSQSGISTFSLLRSREVVNDYGYTTEDMVNSILTLETSVDVDENEDYSMRICSSENELVTKILDDSLHIDQGSIIAGLVETVKSLKNEIEELKEEVEAARTLRSELDELRREINELKNEIKE